MNWRDRIRDKLQEIADRLDLSREAWGKIAIAVGISLIIVVIILAIVMPSKGMVNDAIADFQGQVNTISQQVQGAISQSQDALSQAQQAQSAIQNITDSLGIQAGELSLYHAQLTNAFGRLNAVENSVANFHCSVPEDYLTGLFPNYTLCVKSSEAGNFTANVHLAYPAPIYVGNTTSYDETVSAFYAGINFTQPTLAYVPVITFNGTSWGISEVWFNISTFEVIDEASIPITCLGLNLTPSFAYVEVYKI